MHRMGIIGFGGMGGWHEELIRSIEGLEVLGVYDIRPERLKAAEGLGLTAFSSLEELLGCGEIEFVLISTPNDVHMPLAIMAMEAGKHVVCEKPAALSSQELMAMARTAEETGRFLTVHQNRRWDEDYLTVKELLKQEKLGNLYRLESRVHGSRGIPGDWRGTPEHGGGMVLDWGVHLLDQMLMLFPDKKITSVYATLTHVTNQLVDDGFSAELTFEDGVTALVEVGTSNFLALPRWYVLGQDGTAVIEDWNSDCRIVRASGINEEDVVPVKTAAGLTKTMAPRRDDTISEEIAVKVKSDIRDFYRNVMAVLEHREEPKIKLSEVARVMRLMETVFASAKTGQALPFEK